MVSPLGTTGYLMGFVPGEIAKKRHPWLRITATEAPGYAFNLKFHGTHPEMWYNTVIGTGQQAQFLGKKGLPPIDEVIVGYRMLLLNEGILPFLVTFDPDLKTIDDLVGKRVALGYMTQTLWGDHPWRHINAVGLDEQMELSFTGPYGAMHALIDGLADAAISSQSFNPATGEIRPSPQFIELEGTGRELYYIPMSEESVEALAATGYPTAKYEVSAGSWKYLEEDTVFSVFKCGMGAKDVFPEEIAYEIVKLHLDYYPEMADYHVIFEFYGPELFMLGQTKTTLHPGAIRAYEEAGYTIPD